MMRQHLYMPYTEKKKKNAKYIVLCLKQSLSHHSEIAHMIMVSFTLTKCCQGSLNPREQN